MVVEDDESNRIAMTEALKKMGYEVLSATDGSDGLRVWLHNRKTIDLIITDNNMPKITGVVMLEKILAVDPRTKAIMITGKPEQIDLRAMQGVPILQKPVDLKELEKLIKDLLS